MRLRDFLEPEAIDLELRGATRDAVFEELVGLLRLGEKQAQTVVRQLLRREVLGSTGFGQGVAIPHCRTLAVSRLRLAFGRHAAGIPMEAMDGRPVKIFFLIVAPPMEVSNQYLPVLGRIAQFVREPDIPARLTLLAGPDDLFRLMDDRGA
jgi:mannitol/fructose-specific phosphotransferase system IIA component (Ntr-type)